MNIFFSDEQDEPVDGAGLRRLAELVLADEGLPAGTELSLILDGIDLSSVRQRRRYCLPVDRATKSPPAAVSA